MEVEVQPWVLLAGAGADATADATGVDRWGRGGTSFGTSGEHYRIEWPQPSYSLSPCGCR
jgi:hypothetical protein